jgi:hypothetical protein
VKTKHKDLNDEEQPAKRQQTLQLGVQSISRVKKQKFDKATTLSIFINARLFSLYNNQYIRSFLNLLLDHLYTPLNWHLISSNLLLEMYYTVRGKVLSLLEE